MNTPERIAVLEKLLSRVQSRAKSRSPRHDRAISMAELPPEARLDTPPTSVVKSTLLTADTQAARSTARALKAQEPVRVITAAEEPSVDVPSEAAVTLSQARTAERAPEADVEITTSVVEVSLDVDEAMVEPLAPSPEPTPAEHEPAAAATEAEPAAAATEAEPAAAATEAEPTAARETKPAEIKSALQLLAEVKAAQTARATPQARPLPPPLPSPKFPPPLPVPSLDERAPAMSPAVPQETPSAAIEAPPASDSQPAAAEMPVAGEGDEGDEPTAIHTRAQFAAELAKLQATSRRAVPAIIDDESTQESEVVPPAAVEPHPEPAPALGAARREEAIPAELPAEPAAPPTPVAAAAAPEPFHAPARPLPPPLPRPAQSSRPALAVLPTAPEPEPPAEPRPAPVAQGTPAPAAPVAEASPAAPPVAEAAAELRPSAPPAPAPALAAQPRLVPIQPEVIEPMRVTGVGVGEFIGEVERPAPETFGDLLDGTLEVTF